MEERILGKVMPETLITAATISSMVGQVPKNQRQLRKDYRKTRANKNKTAKASRKKNRK